jgi:hypothetical protein
MADRPRFGWQSARLRSYSALETDVAAFSERMMEVAWLEGATRLAAPSKSVAADAMPGS